MKVTGTLKKTSNLILVFLGSQKGSDVNYPWLEKISLEILKIKSTSHTSQNNTIRYFSICLPKSLTVMVEKQTQSWHSPSWLNCSTSLSPPSSVILFLPPFHLVYILQPIFFKPTQFFLFSNVPMRTQNSKFQLTNGLFDKFYFKVSNLQFGNISP